MASTTAPTRIIPSYPHIAGKTKLAYSPDGKFLLTAGADQLIRKFHVDEESKEPQTFEQHTEPVTAIAASRNAFASASEDCTVNLFDMRESSEPPRMLTRCTLPIRDVAFTSNGEWLGVASEYVPLKSCMLIDQGDECEDCEYDQSFPGPDSTRSFQVGQTHYFPSKREHRYD